MNVLLLSTGGGGANILRSLTALFDRDVAGVRQTDAAYAERLRRAVTTRFLDTNEFSLAQVPLDERILIGPSTTRGLGSRHSPELALRALDESHDEVEQLLSAYAVIVLLGTGGKGTGAGTIFPLAQMARELGKLVLPVFVRPSFERHEVDKRRYDHALQVVAAFDAAQIRLIEILNDRAYSADDPQPQEVVWERMNLPIARGLRGLLYVLWDLSQVDPSDLSILLAGSGRVRIGFAEVAPAAPGDPSDAEIAEAVHSCWENPYCAFSRPVGTSLICIQGDWSNLADAKIKGGLAALALADTRGRPYNPLYARASATPKPWGLTALFTEFTGVHQPLALDWGVERAMLAETHVTRPIDTAHVLAPAAPRAESAPWQPSPIVNGRALDSQAGAVRMAASEQRVERPFDTVWDFFKALNRSDRKALEIAAGAPRADLPVDSATVKRLLTTAWFRSVFALLSDSWRGHLLDALSNDLVIPNHALRLGRHTVCLAEMNYAQVREVSAQTLVRGAAGADLHLLLTIGQLWGEPAFRRLRFAAIEPGDSLRPGSVFRLHGSRSAGT